MQLLLRRSSDEKKVDGMAGLYGQATKEKKSVDMKQTGRFWLECRRLCRA